MQPELLLPAFMPDLDLEWFLRVVVIIFAISIHECAHAYSAYLCGDETAYRAGRVTLNPIAHFDPLGFICVVFAPFGWGKPCPVNPLNYRKPRRDEVIVSLAGVATNFATALVAGIIFRILYGGGIIAWRGPVYLLLQWMVVGNLALCFFNLIPVFPLDGSHVLEQLLPYRMAEQYRAARRFAPIILIFMILVEIDGRSIIGHIILPPVFFFASLFAGF
jgi:Zn-dependent protease